MPGDPKECREHARRCAELANSATTPEARDQFLSLQLSWIRLAADLDNAKAFIDAMDEMDAAAADQGRGVALGAVRAVDACRKLGPIHACHSMLQVPIPV